MNTTFPPKEFRVIGNEPSAVPFSVIVPPLRVLTVMGAPRRMSCAVVTLPVWLVKMPPMIPLPVADCAIDPQIS